MSIIIGNYKGESKAESEGKYIGPVVTQVHFQHIVSSWTGIPVENLSSAESACLLKME